MTDGVRQASQAQRLTSGELSQACETLAANLAHAGVQQGDRSAVMRPNDRDAVLCVAAVALMGGVLVPLGTRLKRPEIGYVLSDSEPAAVIFAPEFAAEMPEHRGGFPMHFNVGSPAWQQRREDRGLHSANPLRPT
jgi:acyl-CoA synthetase (AMP-forming)/AMP-acid ligase II